MKTQRPTLSTLSIFARRVVHGLAVAGLALSIGCASTLDEGQLAGFEFMRGTVTKFSSNPMVCVPTALGNVAGGLVGAPLALAVYPAVWPATWFTSNDDYLFQAYGTTFWGPVLLMGGATGGLFYPISMLMDEDSCRFANDLEPVEE